MFSRMSREFMTEICAHTNRRIFSKFDDVQLYECTECFLVFRESTDLDRRPELLYDDFYKNELPSRFRSFVEYVVRLLRFYRALKIFTIAPHTKTILDIGSGRGFTLYYLRKFFRYRRTAGTQISRPALEFSRVTLGLEIYGEDLLERSWENNSFEVVAMWHVLEHVIFPEQYIAKIYDILTSDGLLIIEVPNLSSWTRRLTGKYWLGLDLKYHLNFFSPTSLIKMLKRHNFLTTLVHTFSLEYSTFLSTQSIISRLTKTNQLVFQWLQGTKLSLWKLVAHWVLTAIIVPVCLLINLALFFTKKGEVLCIVAKKMPKDHEPSTSSFLSNDASHGAAAKPCEPTADQ
jgi:SAM-dependent methyltransferase